MKPVGLCLSIAVLACLIASLGSPCVAGGPSDIVGTDRWSPSVAVAPRAPAGDTSRPEGSPEDPVARARFEAWAKSRQYLRLLRLRRWKETLESRLRCVDKEVSLDRFVIGQMERMYTSRISSSYYVALADLWSRLRKALVLQARLRYLVKAADRKVDEEVAFCPTALGD